MGQRNSIGPGGLQGVNPGPKKTSIGPSSQQGSPKVAPGGRGSSPHSQGLPSSPNTVGTATSGGTSSVTKGKKTVRASLKDAVQSSKRTPNSKTKLPISSSQTSNSPSSLTGKVLQKTATVSPAPDKTAGINSGTLPRFGFKSGSSAVAYGGSTDSVNSILSDAQTVSDANSNIFDLGEDNISGTSSSSSSSSSSDLVNRSRSSVVGADDSVVPVSGAESPCTISQASSGVTSAILNGKYKAQTKQLPSPQVISVKQMNNKRQNYSSNLATSTANVATNSTPLKSKYSSPISRRETSSPQRSPAVTHKDLRSKIPQNVGKSSPPKGQRMSRDSESSNKSLNTVDSGLGSSSESDKCRTPESRLSKGREKALDTGQSREEESLSSLENGFDLDLSDAWLKEKKLQLEGKKKPDTEQRSKNNGTPFQGGLKTVGKLPQKDSFKEKRDSNITYGMARQKFAPYNRNRVSYQTSNMKSVTGHHSENTLNKQDSFQTKLSPSGMVRTRIAQLEKTPVVATADTSQKTPKKPPARPTSIEKTPILVTSKIENTIELSRSICRRLEYSEGKSALLDSSKDNRNDGRLIELPTTAQDFLMVDSFEVKKEDSKKIAELYESSMDSNKSSKISVNLPSLKTVVDNECSELKRIKDISECENSMKRFVEEQKENASIGNTDVLNLPLPDSSAKVFSPDGSETSFEVLESGSVDCSPRDEVASENVTNLNQLVAGFAASSSPSGVGNSAKHSQTSPSRTIPPKKSRQDSVNEETLNARDELPRSSSSKGFGNSGNSGSKSVMESSMDSNRSDGNRAVAMSDSGDRWTVSGKCTPTLSSTRGDVDQDFLIDDEISDQPGLTFGDDLDASLFGDEDLFSDISSPSASHILSKTDRSRHGSLGTTSSVGPDDLMLDYELEDTKQIGNCLAPPSSEEKKAKCNRECPKKPVVKKASSSSINNNNVDNNNYINNNTHVLDISIPGPRYDEEVLSPVACDILSEWSAILAGTHHTTPPSRSNSQSCISQQSSVASNARGSTLNEGTSDPRESISVTTHQPLTSTCDSSSPFVGGGGSIDKAVTAPHSSVDLTIGSGSGVSARVRTVGTETDSNNNGSLSQLSSSVQDLKKPPLNLKPPRQGGPSEHEGGVNIDRTTLHYICQDVTAMKTLLLRLRRVLQVTDTLNPFDANLKTSLYLNLGTSDSGDKEEMNSVQDVFQQNVDLKRQVVLLQQRLEEKDRNIRSLQQQLSQALNLQKSDTSNKNNNNTNISGSQQFPFLTPSSSYITTSSSSSEDGLEPGNSPKPVAVVTANAATQTDRFPTHTRASPFSLASMSRTSSIEDGLGPTVSSESTNCKNAGSGCSSYHVIEDPSSDREEPEPPPSREANFPSTEFLSSSASSASSSSSSSARKLPHVPLTPPVAGSLAS